MLIAAIITGILGVAFGVLWLTSKVTDSYGDWAWWPGVLFFVFGFIWLICFLVALNLNPGTQKLTGYIYSSENQFGYTTGHIRFSENAGTDEQPSFCVTTDSKAGQQITELAGSGKKVTVTIPPYFYFANNPFACGTTETKIEVKS